MMTRSEIMAVRSLGDRKGRRESGLFIVEGRKMVREALDSPFRVKEIYATAETAGDFHGARAVSPSEFGRISSLKSPQGVLALVEIPEYGAVKVRRGELVIALDRVQDPGNLGTIVRIADWFGVSDIVCSRDTADCYNPKAVQATMGSLFRVRVHYAGLEEFLAGAVADGLPVYGAFMDGESIYGMKSPAGGVLIMGNEGGGIGPAAGKYVTRRISIPPYPVENTGAESLNVAVATAVIVAEFRRRLPPCGDKIQHKPER